MGGGIKTKVGRKGRRNLSIIFKNREVKTSKGQREGNVQSLVDDFESVILVFEDMFLRKTVLQT